MKKVLTKGELANLYGVHTKTLMKWLKEIPDFKNRVNGRIFTPKQVEKIFNHLGNPISND